MTAITEVLLLFVTSYSSFLPKGKRFITSNGINCIQDSSIALPRETFIHQCLWCGR